MNQEPRVTIHPSPFVMLVTAGSAVIPPEALTRSMYGSPLLSSPKIQFGHPTEGGDNRLNR